jgi:ATP-dependent RNA helicase DOB1
MQLLGDRIKSHPLASDATLPELYELYARKQDVNSQIREMRKKVQAARDIMQLEELRCRKRVLRRLGFASSADVVEMKGRVACEISTGDELLLTEMIFEGVFNTLSPEQTAALLSCFVFAEKVSVDYLLYTQM